MSAVRGSGDTRMVHTLAGYRLVRLLARGTHSEVWLGVTDAATAPVAIKLFHPTTPLTRVNSEVEALGRISHRHAQQLLDVSVDPAGRTSLVLERLGPSLARVLSERTSLSEGEAVTVLAPLCDALGELHRVGVAHGRLDAGSILFDSAGAPVLSRFGSAVLVGGFPLPPQPSSLTPAERSSEPNLTADRVGLARLAEHVLQHASGDRSVLGWLTQLTSTPDGFVQELAERLYASGPATPVAMPSPVTDRAASSLALRTHLGLDDPEPAANRDEEESAPETTAAPGWLGSTAVASLMPPWLDSWIERMRAEWLVGSRGGDLLERVRAALSVVRPRVWIVAVCGLGAVVFTIALLGAQSPPPADTATSEAGAAALELASAVEPAPVSADPLGAARELLERREGCFRELSVLCLDGANQSDSAVMDADRLAIRRHQQGAPHADRVDWSNASLTLIDEFGDGALVQASVEPLDDANVQPITATLLLVRSDHGWRIRDIIE